MLTPAPPPDGVPRASDVVVWQSPESCGDPGDVRATLLRSVEPGTHVDAIEVNGRIQGSGSGYRLSLVVRSGARMLSREIEGETCQELTDAAALIVGLVARTPSTTPLPTESALPEPAQPTPVGATTAMPTGPVDRPESRSDRPDVRRRAWEFALTPELAIGTYVTTPLALALGGSVHALRGSLRMSLGVTHWLERGVVVEDTAWIGLHLTHGSVRVCWTPRRKHLEFPLCGGMALGGMRAKPETGLVQTRAGTQFWAAASASIGVMVTFPWVSLGLRANAIVPLLRPAFSVGSDEGSFEVYRAPQIGGFLAVALEFRFPRDELRR